MTQIDGEEDLSRHHVAAVRPALDQPDRADRVRRVPCRDRGDRHHHPGRAQQRVLPQPHRRGAGMAFPPIQRHLVPAHPLHPGDDADHRVLGLQDRALLDMQLEMRRQRMRAAGLFAAIADRVQRRLEAHAAPVSAVVCPLPGEGAGEHARRQHGRGEARALLVGPVDYLDRRRGAGAAFLQHTQHLQTGQHADHAVEFAAGRLGIEMAADRDRRQRRIAAGTPGEDVAHVVERDGAADRFALRHEPGAHLRVELGERQPAQPALRGGADRSRFQHALPETVGIDRQVAGQDTVSGALRCGLFGCSPQVSFGPVAACGTMVMQSSTGQTCAHRLQPTHSASITS